MTRLLMIAAALAVLMGASGGAAWWFFVRAENQLATSAPDIPDDLVDATASATPAGAAATEDATTGDVVTYQINADVSEAAYFVDEELASIGLPSTAKGTTNEIEGQFVLTADGADLASSATSSFTVDLRNLTSDESRRDGRVQEALDTSQFPTATFTISDVTGYDPAVTEGEEQTLQLTGTLDLHSVQREVTWDVKAKREGNVISALATLTVVFSDYDITPPRFGGLVSIDDEATL